MPARLDGLIMRPRYLSQSLKATRKHHPSLWRPNRRFLHSSSRALASNEPSHYETLNLSSSASGSQIKTSFYALSRKHHPDLHPDDPDASSRFARISTAYHALADPKARAQYDRHHGFGRHPQSSSSSHASPQRPTYAGPAGGRPASGLSSRRTRFQGPPPSFFRSGGWGAQSSKRQKNAADAHQDASPAENRFRRARASADANANASAGSGSDARPPPPPAGYSDDVPHFDREGHLHVHEGLAARLRGRRERLAKEAAARRARAGEGVVVEEEARPIGPDFGRGQPGGNVGAFFVLLAIMVAAATVPFMGFGSEGSGSGAARRKRRDERNQIG